MKIEDNSVDFSSMITQTGRYTFQVRTVNRYVTSNKSKWVSSERWEIDEELLQSIRTTAGNSNNNYYNGNTSTSNPFGSVSGWQYDTVGRWYKNYDGTWPASRWQQIDGFWYYFNQESDGYKGALLTNTETPDGYWVNEKGQRVE